MRLRTFHWPVTGATLSALAVGLAGCGPPRPHFTPGPPEVGVVAMRVQPTPLVTELPGRTSPFAISDVRPQVNGIVQARMFAEGGTVKKGQILYRIDPAPYRAAVDQAKAQLANAEANLTTVRLKAERYADLVKLKGVSQQDYDDAKAAYGQGQASVEQSRANLEAAQINLGYTEIRAPISGRIGLSTLTQGALAVSGQTQALTTIQTLDPIYVDLTQSSVELLRLERDIAEGEARKDQALSAKVDLVLEDGSTYPLQGRLEFTDVTVDPNSGAVTLRALFPNPKGVLLPGMYVRARVTEGLVPDAILAPQQGVTRDPQGNASVMLVGADGKATVRPIQTSRAVGANWLVTKGLAPGDRVIVEGLQRVRPGAPVRVVAAGAPPSAGPPAPKGGGRP